MSNGYEISMPRLNQLRKKLRKDEPLFQHYDTIFKTQVQDGNIERV